MKTPIDRPLRLRLARELVLGAPVGAAVWLLLLRLIIGEWTWVFPGVIIGVSLLVAATVTSGVEPVASGAYRGWKGLVHAIDWLVTRVVCALLYFGLFTPVALVLKLLRVSLLDMRPDRATTSYWRTLPVTPTVDRKRYFRQF